MNTCKVGAWRTALEKPSFLAIFCSSVCARLLVHVRCPLMSEAVSMILDRMVQRPRLPARAKLTKRRPLTRTRVSLSAGGGVCLHLWAWTFYRARNAMNKRRKRLNIHPPTQPCHPFKMHMWGARARVCTCARVRVRACVCTRTWVCVCNTMYVSVHMCEGVVQCDRTFLSSPARLLPNTGCSIKNAYYSTYFIYIYIYVQT